MAGGSGSWTVGGGAVVNEVVKAGGLVVDIAGDDRWQGVGYWDIGW